MARRDGHVSDDLSCAHDVIDAQLAEMPMPRVIPEGLDARGAWLARRSRRLGASEVAVAMACLGDLDAGRLTKAQQHEAAIIERGHGRGLPRLVARKAGLLREPKARADVEGYREVELVEAFRAEVSGATGKLGRIDPESVRHASVIPIELQPIVDRECDELAVSLDGWCREWWDGPLVTIDCKRTGSRFDTPRESWQHQIVAQCAAARAAWGVLVVGVGWAVSPEARGPVEIFVVEPTAAEIERVRDTARRFMREVERAAEASDGR